MAKSSYTLVPRAVPSRQRTSYYKQIIEEFTGMKENSVLVAETGRKPVTLVQGLRKVVDSEGASDIKVVQRGDETFLVRG